MSDVRRIGKDATRKALLDAAADILRASGVKGLTMRKLAGAVGYTPGALYTHFQSKSDLIMWLAYDALGRLAVSCRSEVPEQQLAAIHDYLQSQPADRAILAEALSEDAAAASGEVTRLVVGRLIRILRTLPQNDGQEDAITAITALALLIGAVAMGSSPLLQSLGFTGDDILSHYADSISKP